MFTVDFPLQTIVYSYRYTLFNKPFKTNFLFFYYLFYFQNNCHVTGSITITYHILMHFRTVKYFLPLFRYGKYFREITAVCCTSIPHYICTNEEFRVMILSNYHSEQIILISNSDLSN